MTYTFRLECRASPYSSHISQKNLHDSPLCTCSSGEITCHYLEQHPKYTIIRNLTPNEFTHPTYSDLLSSGSNDLNNIENHQIVSKRAIIYPSK